MSPSNGLLLKSEQLFVHRYCYQSRWITVDHDYSSCVQPSSSFHTPDEKFRSNKNRSKDETHTRSLDNGRFNALVNVHFHCPPVKFLKGVIYQDAFLLSLVESTLDKFHLPRPVFNVDNAPSVFRISISPLFALSPYHPNAVERHKWCQSNRKLRLQKFH